MYKKVPERSQALGRETRLRCSLGCFRWILRALARHAYYKKVFFIKLMVSTEFLKHLLSKAVKSKCLGKFGNFGKSHTGRVSPKEKVLGRPMTLVFNS